ncbi:class A beta-lactamase [Sphingopyxis sp.]|jgi:beta-lactamase class A|uniref:class A beta-lactamase n=1 Tax=Sphingopyxis sp. TaxID=1908224 RepID=UPI002E00A840|nr:class A beta-lactamase [Sphingopyxis sp.]
MRMLLAAALLATSACATSPREATGDSVILAKAVTAIERRSGGRLGVAVTDARGALLFGHRADERFAMCSTFKLLLAGQVLARAADGVSLRTPLPFTHADLVTYSPGTEKLLGANGHGEQRLSFAARDAVVLSDNTAANLILAHIGGPSAFTAEAHRRGDRVTRLDRNEPTLNENAPRDVRDTTSPAAIAKSAAGYVYGDWLAAAHRETLRGWMIESETGLKRIRGGLPQGWVAGDKTGTCGTAYNDVAFVEEPGGAKYMIAVYLDRPAVKGDEASAVIADVARAVVQDLP